MPMPKAPLFKRLFLDIETSPNTVLSWRVGGKVYLDHENILTERAIIMVGWKWEHQSRVNVWTWNDGDDASLLKAILPILDEADEIVAHNGNHFDLPWIRTRCLFHGIPCNWDYRSLDTLAEARRRLYLNSNKLDYISRYVGRQGKIKTDFDLWKRVLDGQYNALQEMIRYCRQDVLELEQVFQKLAPYIAARTHRGVAEGGSKWQCPHCGSAQVLVNKTRTTAFGIQRKVMKCRKCTRYYTICMTAHDQMIEERIKDPDVQEEK